MPSLSQIERGWVMRQASLDDDAGREMDPQRYSREFHEALAEHDRAVAEAARKAGAQQALLNAAAEADRIQSQGWAIGGNWLRARAASISTDKAGDGDA